MLILKTPSHSSSATGLNEGTLRSYLETLTRLVFAAKKINVSLKKKKEESMLFSPHLVAFFDARQ